MAVPIFRKAIDLVISWRAYLMSVQTALTKGQKHIRNALRMVVRSITKCVVSLLNGSKDFDVKLIQADIKHPEIIRQMCKQAKVLIDCVGLYRFFGEGIVKTCVETNTHYVDISGEPEFLERMQLKYDQEAKKRGLYIVSACGFDSIPSEMGIAFTKHNFKGELDSVETFMSFKSGPAGTAVHYGTWESAVHGISSAGELPPIRKELFKERLPRSSHKIKQSTIKTCADVEGYAIPFPGADRSVARRIEYFEFTEQQRRPSVLARVFMTFLMVAFLPTSTAQTCPCPCGTWPAVLPVFIQMCQCPCVSLPAMPTPNLGSPPFSSPLNSGFYPSNPFSTPTTTAAPVVIHIAHADVIHIGARQDVNHTTETEEMSGKNVSSANASHRADDCRGSSSRFILLAEDKNVKVEYDTYRSYSSDQQLAANFVFTNKRSDASLKNISFEVVDSAGLFVDTSTGVVVPVKFPEVLPKSNWAMCIFFTLTTDTSSPQTVRGRVSYVVVDFAGNSRPEMNDFKMQFCS